ncbi:uncharacterized protein LOC135808455 [Sycon ciliatum]|uniref:uncharacterized protein LOC135808455 n=1 Tax=Sycon ciliatum TaxID=27933 RepID=UPI0020A92D87|eukprot:scpid41110/ scgid32163/ Protein asteroid homolog 1
MGIPRLTSFVFSKDMREAWNHECMLRDTRLVVDGNGLLYLFLESGRGGNLQEIRYGGQYSELYGRLREFFTELQDHGVHALVVLDGQCSAEKLQTSLQRGAAQARYLRGVAQRDADHLDAAAAAAVSAAAPAPSATALTVWALMVFTEALVDGGVPLVRAEQEADDLIAAIGRHWECPVLSADSDFFICDLPHGVIHLKSISCSHPCLTTVSLYQRSSFVRVLSKMQAFSGFSIATIENVLPLAASLCGNDYVHAQEVSHLFPSDKRKDHAIVDALEWLLVFLGVESVDDGLLKVCDLPKLKQNPATVNAIRHSIRTYGPAASWSSAAAEHCVSVDCLSTPLARPCALHPHAAIDVAGEAVHHYSCGLLEAFRLGFVHPGALAGALCDFTNISLHLDSPTHAPISDVDRPLRALLLVLGTSRCSSVKEIVRSPRDVHVQAVSLKAANAIAGIGDLPPREVMAHYDPERRRHFLLSACYSAAKCVMDLPLALQLVIASLRFAWKKLSSCSKTMPVVLHKHIAILLVGVVNGCQGNIRSALFNSRKSSASQKKRLAQWCVAGSAPPAAARPSQEGDSGGSVSCRTAQAAAAEPLFRGRADCQTVHIFNAWQRVLMALLLLNWVMDLPFPPLCVHNLYDGISSFALLESCSSVKDVLETSRHDTPLVEMLWRTVEDGMDDATTESAPRGPSSDGGSGQQPSKKKKKKERKGAATSRTVQAAGKFADKNPFALLGAE